MNNRRPRPYERKQASRAGAIVFGIGLVSMLVTIVVVAIFVMPDVNRRLERLYDSLDTGKVELADLAPRIKELRTRQEKLLARKVELEILLSDRRVELASPEIVRSYVADLRTLLTRSELTERRAFIRSFVKEVRVTNDEVVISYTMPLVSNGLSEDKIGVLPIVKHGRPCRSRTCDTLIKSHGVSNQARKEVSSLVLTP